MLKRESELQHTKLVQRAYSLPYSDSHAISLQVQLRVAREFSLPDSTVEVFHGSPGTSSQELLSEARYGSPWLGQHVQGSHHFQTTHPVRNYDLALQVFFQWRNVYS